MTKRESPEILGGTGGDVGYQIVSQVAKLEETDPIELEPPLYEVINADAIESLFHRDDARGNIAFTYLGYDVLVDADGTVSVSG